MKNILPIRKVFWFTKSELLFEIDGQINGNRLKALELDIGPLGGHPEPFVFAFFQRRSRV